MKGYHEQKVVYWRLEELEKGCPSPPSSTNNCWKPFGVVEASPGFVGIVYRRWNSGEVS